MKELQAVQTLLSNRTKSDDWVTALTSLSPEELGRLASIAFKLHGAALSACAIKKAEEGTLVTRIKERTNK